MTISLCVVTNECSASLIRCLASVQGVADEIVLLDNTPDGRVIDMARAFDARAERWTQQPFHFADARNHAIDLASGDWILLLDADEYLPPEQGPKVKALTQGDAYAYTVLTHSYFDNGRWAAWPVTRLFRRDPRIRLRQPIHESVNYSLLKHDLKHERSDVVVDHFGYLRDDTRLRDKAEFYLDRVIARRQQDPDDAVSWWHEGIAYASIGNLPRAIECTDTAIEIDPLHKLPRILLARYQRITGETKAAIDLLSEVFESGNRAWRATAGNLLGMCHLDRGETHVAQEKFEQVTRDPVQTAHAWANLAVCQHLHGQYDDAIRSCCMAIQLNPALLRMSGDGKAHRYSFQEDVSSRYSNMTDLLDRCGQRQGDGHNALD